MAMWNGWMSEAKTKPKISVIVIIYKVAPFLEECLKSVASQTYENLEVILVLGCDENGNYFGCKEIAEAFARKDPRFRIVTCRAAGAGDARNKGLDQATGDFIGWVDGDDFVEPNIFECLYANLIKYDAEVSVCGHFDEYPESTPVRAGCLNAPALMSPGKIFSAREICGTLLSSTSAVTPTFFFHSWDKLFKAEAFMDRRFPVDRHVEDRYTIGDILLSTKRLVFDSTPLYHFRVRSDSLSRISDIAELNIEADHAFCRKALLLYPDLKEEAEAFLLYGHITCIQNLLISNPKLCCGLSAPNQTLNRHLAYIRKHERSAGKNTRITRNLRIKIFCALHFPVGLWLITYRGKKKSDKAHAEKFHI